MKDRVDNTTSRDRNCWPGDLVELIKYGAPDFARLMDAPEEPWDESGYVRGLRNVVHMPLGTVCLVTQIASTGWGYQVLVDGQSLWIKREQCRRFKKVREAPVQY